MRQKKVKSISDALSVLDRASDRSVQAIKRKLKGELVVMRPQLQEKFEDLKDETVRKLTLVRDKAVKGSRQAVKTIDKEAHKKPWHFVGVFSLFAVFFGFLLGRKTKK